MPYTGKDQAIDKLLYRAWSEHPDYLAAPEGPARKAFYESTIKHHVATAETLTREVYDRIKANSPHLAANELDILRDFLNTKEAALNPAKSTVTANSIEQKGAKVVEESFIKKHSVPLALGSLALLGAGWAVHVSNTRKQVESAPTIIG